MFSLAQTNATQAAQHCWRWHKQHQQHLLPMHPPLIVDRHPICGKYMEALVQCHKDHTIAKWWGACNDEHWALTRCLTEEKKILRAERQELAREKFRQQRAETERRMAEKQQQQQQQQVLEPAQQEQRQE